MATELKQPSLRVILWASPRSLSTVLEKCLSYVDGVQIVNEPYNTAAQAGPDRKESTNPFRQNVDEFLKKASEEGDKEIVGWDDNICTYKWVKDTLETEYPAKKLVFCKDLMPGIADHFDMIPRGYRHTFLIRNPTKTALSLRKLIINSFLPQGFPKEMFRLDQMFQLTGTIDTNKFIFGDMLDLITYLKENGIEEDPIIIDADDLQNHPKPVLRKYCEAVGIPYSDSLLQFEAGDEIVRKNWLTSKTLLQGNKTGSYYEAAFASSCFEPAKDPPSDDDLPPDVVVLAKTGEPFYKELYERRLKP